MQFHRETEKVSVNSTVSLPNHLKNVLKNIWIYYMKKSSSPI